MASADLIDTADLAHAPHAIDGHHFRRALQAHIRRHRVLVLGVGQLDRLGLLTEQIDDRRAIELEVIAPDVLRQACQTVAEVVVGEVEIDLDLLDVLARQNPRKARQVEEHELVGEGEVLVQQAIAEERALRIVHQAFVQTIADRFQRVGRQDDLTGAPLIFEAQRGLGQVVEQQFVQLQHQRAFAVEEKPQAVEFHLAEHHIGGRDQTDAQARNQVGTVAVERRALHLDE
ncbi:hypothetical protein D3C87_1325620 [compost metagenome]